MGMKYSCVNNLQWAFNLLNFDPRFFLPKYLTADVLMSVLFTWNQPVSWIFLMFIDRNVVWVPWEDEHIRRKEFSKSGITKLFLHMIPILSSKFNCWNSKEANKKEINTEEWLIYSAPLSLLDFLFKFNIQSVLISICPQHPSFSPGSLNPHAKGDLKTKFPSILLLCHWPSENELNVAYNH